MTKKSKVRAVLAAVVLAGCVGWGVHTASYKTHVYHGLSVRIPSKYVAIEHPERFYAAELSDDGYPLWMEHLSVSFSPLYENVPVGDQLESLLTAYVLDYGPGKVFSSVDFTVQTSYRSKTGMAIEIVNTAIKAPTEQYCLYVAVPEGLFRLEFISYTNRSALWKRLRYNLAFQSKPIRLKLVGEVDLIPLEDYNRELAFPKRRVLARTLPKWSTLRGAGH